MSDSGTAPRPAHGNDFLAVDLGGTHARVAWCRGPDPEWRVHAAERYANAEHAGLDAVLAAFTARHGAGFRAAGVAVAGPVVGDTARLTNLPWVVDARELRRQLACPVTLMNDMEAHAHGALALGDARHTVLQAGTPAPLGNAAMIAIGTGLGEVIIARDGARALPRASEGSHADFAPHEADDLVLWTRLTAKYGGHVSWERVVSGKDGLRNLYEHLLALGRINVPAHYAQQLDGSGDIGAVIADADARGEPFAHAVLQLCARLYGAEAGNLALKALATSGVYIGGGLSQRVLTPERRAAFLTAFAAKGRFRELLSAVPIYMVTAAECALLGAAAHAAHASQP